MPDGSQYGRWVHPSGDYFACSSSEKRSEQMDEKLCDYDCGHPRPVPEPRCGQVWVTSVGEALMVTAVCERKDWRSVSYGDGSRSLSWPPLDAVLAAGPGAPWKASGSRSQAPGQQAPGQQAPGQQAPGQQAPGSDTKEAACP